MASVEELRGIIAEGMPKAMAFAMSMFDKQQAEADKAVGKEMAKLAKRYVSVLQGITGMKTGWVISPTPHLLSIDNEEGGITIDIHWEVDLGSGKADVTVELNKRSGPEGPGAKWKSKIHVIRNVMPDAMNLSPAKTITDAAVRRFLKEHARELLAPLMEESGWQLLDEGINKYDIRRAEETWKDAEAIADSYEEDGDPRARKARADAAKLKKDHDALVAKWEKQKKKSREYSRARAGAMRSVGMVRTRSGRWEDTAPGVSSLDEAKMNPYAQKVKRAMDKFVRTLPRVLQSASKGGIPWKLRVREDFYKTDEGLYDSAYFASDARVEMQKKVVTSPSGDPFVTVQQWDADTDEFSISVGLDFEESGTEDFIEVLSATSADVVKILSSRAPSEFKRWLGRVNFTYTMPEEAEMSTADELRAIIERKGSPYQKRTGTSAEVEYGKKERQAIMKGVKSQKPWAQSGRSGESKQEKKAAKKAERSSKRREIDARMRGEGIDEEIASIRSIIEYKGDPYARRGDPAGREGDLDHWEKKYVQSSSKTRKGVKRAAAKSSRRAAKREIQARMRGEGVSLDDFGAYLEILGEELQEAMVDADTSPVRPVEPMQMTNLKIIQQTADQLGRFTSEFASWLKRAMRAKEVDVEKLGRFGRQVDAAHRIFKDTYRKLALGYREDMGWDDEADGIEEELDGIEEAMAIGRGVAYEVPSPVPFAKKATLAGRRHWRKQLRKHNIPMGAQEMMMELAQIMSSLPMSDRKLVDQMMNMTWYGPEDLGGKEMNAYVDAIKKLHKRVFGRIRGNPTR